jgi:hypothetical protein
VKRKGKKNYQLINACCTRRKIIKFELNRNREKVLGINCDELIAYDDMKIMSYYFNSDTLRINPKWYKNYISFDRNIKAEKMKAICLKIKTEYPEFIFTTTAESISWQKIDDSVFSIPKHKVLIEDK